MLRGYFRNLLSNLPMSDEHVVKVNGHTFKFTWRDITQVGVVVMAIVGSYFAFTGRIDANSRSINELVKRVDSGQEQRDRMDREGTRRSHEIDAMQQQMLEAHDRAIREVNEKLNNIMPKVDKIDANVLWLMGKQLEASKR